MGEKERGFVSVAASESTAAVRCSLSHYPSPCKFPGKSDKPESCKVETLSYPWK